MPGEERRPATVLALVPPRSATSIERGDQGGIDNKLHVAQKREPICDDFDAAIIEALGVDVEVAHQNIAGNCSPSFSAAHGSARYQKRGKQRVVCGGHREGRQDGGSDKLQRREARASEAGGATKRGKQESPR